MKSSESSEFPYKERITSIERRRVGDIAPNERNPKRPTEEKRERLTAVLAQFGKAGVLLTYTGDDGKERFFDGNTRRNLDPDDVWYIAKTDLTQAEVDSLVLFYDPLAEPDWEAELVKMLAAAVDVEGDALAGMLDEILAEVGAELGQPEAGDAEPQTDRAEELRQAWGVELGQMWRLPSRAEGQEHRLICGDCTDATAVERVMGGEKAAAVVTDPPYGQNQAGVTNDEPEKLIGILSGCLYNLPIENGVIVSFASPRTFPTWLDLCREAGHKFERMLWMYKAAQETFPWRGWLLKSEAIPVTSKGNGQWQDVHPYSHDCYYKSEVSNQLSKDSGWHGSVKPLDVVQDLMQRVTPLGGIIYDPFLGSGTTLLAAENLSRQCRAVEISPAYVAVALQRYQDAFGITAELMP